MEEESTTYSELYDKLCWVKEVYFDEAIDEMNKVLTECLDELMLYGELDKISKPLQKYEENLEKIKGKLLIEDRKVKEPPHGVQPLDAFCSDEETADNKQESILDTFLSDDENISDDKIDDVMVKDPPKKKRGRKKKTEDLPEGIYPTAADMAKREADYA